MRAPLAATIACAFALAAAAPSISQAPPAPDLARHRAEIAKLDWLVGEWEGEGWSQRGPERMRATIVERIERRLDGLALLVEGEGRDATDPSQVVHLALGVLSFDEAAGALRLASWTAEGRSVVAEAEATATGFVWSFATPGGGRVRYTVTRGENEWSEVGEFSRDGATWMQIHAMTLRRRS
jgi:hypothetical protein